MEDSGSEEPQLNVLGLELQLCGDRPLTGFYRDGHCSSGSQDFESHTVCVIMTDEFLAFSQLQGNDLTTPMPDYGFPGLKPGDSWCVCASRWKDAVDQGINAPIKLLSTHERALEIMDLPTLKQYARDLS